MNNIHILNIVREHLISNSKTFAYNLIVYKPKTNYCSVLVL